jgi:AAA+ superfamily predicted ATPase
VRVEDCVIVNELRTARSEDLWGSILVDPTLKDRLLRTALLAFRLRPGLPFTVTALHGLALLFGPPGTGKSTLARGLPTELAKIVTGGKVRLIELNLHGVMSAEHGQSQQLVLELLCDYIPRLADDGVPTVVVLDEVESMCVARSAASLSANPADVHRATDAVLAALDRNTTDHPHIVMVATSNFTDSLDEAFKSRADEAILVPLPDQSGIVQILQAALTGFAAKFPALGRLATTPELTQVARSLVGLDGRQVRKVITDAMKVRTETVMDPNTLTILDLQAAAAVRTARKGPARASA